MLPRSTSFQFDDLLLDPHTTANTLPSPSTDTFINSFIFEDEENADVAKGSAEAPSNASAQAIFQQWLNTVALPPVTEPEVNPSSTSKKEAEIESTCSASSSGNSSDDDSKKSTPGTPQKGSKKRKRGANGTKPRKDEDKAKKRREANRLSAAASRERKKRYVKDLEKKVRSMESEHATLRQNMTVTQMENARLRSLVERLARAASRGVSHLPAPQDDDAALLDSLHSEEPSLKRRKICNEISIPALPNHHDASSSLTPSTATMEHDLMGAFDDSFQKVDLPEDNPFNVSFWDKVPTGKAMLFVMIFCIALFVGLGGNAQTDLFYGGAANRESAGHNGMPHMHMGRKILSECLGNEQQRIFELTSFPGVENPTREMVAGRAASLLAQVQRLVAALNGGSAASRGEVVHMEPAVQPFEDDAMEESTTTTTTTTSQRAPRRRLQHHGDIEHEEF